MKEVIGHNVKQCPRCKGENISRLYCGENLNEVHMEGEKAGHAPHAVVWMQCDTCGLTFQILFDITYMESIGESIRRRQMKYKAGDLILYTCTSGYRSKMYQVLEIGDRIANGHDGYYLLKPIFKKHPIEKDNWWCVCNVIDDDPSYSEFDFDKEILTGE
jgi:hypothetical protein